MANTLVAQVSVNYEREGAGAYICYGVFPLIHSIFKCLATFLSPSLVSVGKWELSCLGDRSSHPLRNFGPSSRTTYRRDGKESC